jgi:hypothetical protein
VALVVTAATSVAVVVVPALVSLAALLRVSAATVIY